VRRSRKRSCASTEVGTEDDLAKQWARTERELRAALTEVAVDETTAGEVLNYLDHNELGLAFAVLVEELDRLGATPSPVAMTRLSAAYDRMASLPDGADAWARLKQRT
jgi:hypothetical protein